MAETFQRVIQDTTSSYATIYTCPAATTAIVIGMQAANVHASDPKTFAVQTLTSGGGSAAIIANDISIPSHDTLAPIQGKLVLEAGDYMQIKGADTNIEVTLSVLEIT
tara:strand:- start:293 stop:616 length:324 start_codon:yes stop_codon:yes gene_type:complete